LGSAESTSIAAIAYNQLKKYLGINTEKRIQVSDVFQMLADVETEIIDRLHIDVLNVPTLNLFFGSHYGKWRPWQMFDGTPILVPEDFHVVEDGRGGYLAIEDGVAVACMPKNGFYFDTIVELEGLEPTGMGRHSLGGVLPDTERARHPLMTDEELEFGQQQASLLFEETDKALMGNLHLNITEVGSFEDWFILMMTEPGYLAEYYGKQAESIIKNLELYHDAVGEHLTAVFFGQDFGTQKGEMISPQTFRDIMVPPYKTIFQWVHENTTWKVFFHCCGSIHNIIPDLANIGVDILNPVQTEAANMDPAVLKREFGDRLCFWGGGVEAQRLPFMSVGEVKEQVRERMEVFAPGGGFVFAATHNIQAGTPAENVVAAYDTAYEYGVYPITR